MGRQRRGAVTRRARVGGPAAFRRSMKVKPPAHRSAVESPRLHLSGASGGGGGDAGRAKTAISTPATSSRETRRPGRRGEIANNCRRPLNDSFHLLKRQPAR